MTEAVTPPNPADGSQASYKAGPQPESEPDPTLLTIDSIRREIAIQDARTEDRIESLKDLMDEKFRGVGALMDKAEDQRKEQKADTAAAVDAALESQKEATAKMEKSISDQIASLRGNFETEISSIRGTMADLKERATRSESVKEGAVEQKTEARQVTAGQVALIGIGVTLVMAVVSIVSFVIGGM